jgi:hypothetical protein
MKNLPAIHQPHPQPEKLDQDFYVVSDAHLKYLTRMISQQRVINELKRLCGIEVGR